MLPTSPSGPVILIVDDDPDTLEIYTVFLTQHGYAVMTATGAAEAIETARARRPAIIFMDLRMEDMSGTEAMQMLRQDPGFDNVPIVALTAYAFDAERARALADGFDEFIPKPCRPDELAAAIERLLAKRRRADSPSPAV